MGKLLMLVTAREPAIKSINSNKILLVFLFYTLFPQNKCKNLIKFHPGEAGANHTGLPQQRII
jgi:hypothetical protein